MLRRPVALACLALLLALPARADEPDLIDLERARKLLGIPERDELLPVEDDATAPEEPSIYSDQDLPYPRIRMEAYLRFNGPIRSRVKHGRNGIANTWKNLHDAHMPREPVLGYRFVVDARVHARISIGVHYTRLWMEGPLRHIHHTGIGVQATRFPGNRRVRTTIDVQSGEVFARFVIKDTARVRLAVGLAGAWASHRVRLVDEQGNAASGRAETFFAPAISYWFSIKITPRVSFFFESLSALIAPWRFPSMLSEFRIGLRWHLTDRLELVTAAAWSGGQIADADDLWGGKHTPGHRWQRAEWTSVGGDFGVAFTF